MIHYHPSELGRQVNDLCLKYIWLAPVCVTDDWTGPMIHRHQLFINSQRERDASSIAVLGRASSPAFSLSQLISVEDTFYSDSDGQSQGAAYSSERFLCC